MSEPTLEVVEKKLMRHILHLEEQQSTLCRFMLQMYHVMRDNAYMDDEELSSYLNWSGDRPSSVGGEEDCHEAQSTAGVEKMRKLRRMRKLRKKRRQLLRLQEKLKQLLRLRRTRLKILLRMLKKP